MEIEKKQNEEQQPAELTDQETAQVTGGAGITAVSPDGKEVFVLTEEAGPVTLPVEPEQPLDAIYV